jgi:hypothetical protein
MGAPGRSPERSQAVSFVAEETSQEKPLARSRTLPVEKRIGMTGMSPRSYLYIYFGIHLVNNGIAMGAVDQAWRQVNLRWLLIERCNSRHFSCRKLMRLRQWWRQNRPGNSARHKACRRLIACRNKARRQTTREFGTVCNQGTFLLQLCVVRSVRVLRCVEHRIRHYRWQLPSLKASRHVGFTIDSAPRKV